MEDGHKSFLWDFLLWLECSFFSCDSNGVSSSSEDEYKYEDPASSEEDEEEYGLALALAFPDEDANTEDMLAAGLVKN